MAGHNKWSKVKHIKAAADKKKSAIYSKYIKEIAIAAKHGGPDPENNSRLKKAIADAKTQNVPKDNIERALKKASGDLNDGQSLEELTYEGYGPGGVAILIECITDKRNRTQPELRKILEKSGGTMAEAGAVAWGFEKVGLILVSRENTSEEKVMEVALEAGAADIIGSEEGFEIRTPPTEFIAVSDALEKAQISAELSELTFVPNNKIAVSEETAEKLRALVENLEDHDDAQRVTTNADW